MNERVNRLRLVLAGVTVAVLAIVGHVAFPAASAKAQTNGDIPVVFKSAGPIALNHQESALIGLLLPAVQRGDTTAPTQYQLQLVDSAGQVIVQIPITPDAANRKGAFFEIFFADGSVRVVDRATGATLARVPRSDGLFTAVLLPAVQSNGRAVGPISASIQLFNSNHRRGQIVAMGDGSV